MGIFDFSPTSDEKGMKSPFMEDAVEKEDVIEEAEEANAHHSVPPIYEHELIRDMKDDPVVEEPERIPLSQAIPRSKKLTIKSEEVTTRRIEERSIEVDGEEVIEERTFIAPTPNISASQNTISSVKTPSLSGSFESLADEHQNSLLEALSIHAAGALAERYGLSPMEAAYVEQFLGQENGLSLEQKLEQLGDLLDENREGHRKLKSILSLYSNFKTGIASVKNIVKEIEHLLGDDK